MFPPALRAAPQGTHPLLSPWKGDESALRASEVPEHMTKKMFPPALRAAPQGAHPLLSPWKGDESALRASEVPEHIKKKMFPHALRAAPQGAHLTCTSYENEKAYAQRRRPFSVTEMFWRYSTLSTLAW